MKKLFTLLLAAGVLGTVHAQTSKEEGRRIILGEPKNQGGNRSQEGRDIILGDNGNKNSRTYPDSYPDKYPGNSKEAKVSQINREYQRKIQSIRNNPHLTRSEKDRMIRQLESDRVKKIRAINSSYKKYDGKKTKKHKSNNGKHKGWKKGKGNKHG